MAALLGGQGAALHHDHRRVADCPAGACVEHGDHPAPVASLTDNGPCPLCELAGHGRSVVPLQRAARLPEPFRVTDVASPAADPHRAPALAGPRARAPPHLA